MNKTKFAWATMLVLGTMFLMSGCATAGNLPAYIGDFVWYDDDKDGIQDAGEPGVAGVIAKLYKCDGTFVKQDLPTLDDGWYELSPNEVGFEGQETTDSYYVEFTNIPAGYAFTQKDAGVDDTVDSDAYADGKTDCTKLRFGANYPANPPLDPDWDAGMYEPEEPPECNLVVTKQCQVPSTGICKGKVVSMVFEYTGNPCSATNNWQGDWPDGKYKFKCEPYPGPGPGPGPVSIVTSEPATVVPNTGIVSGNPGTFVTIAATGTNLDAQTDFDIMQGDSVLQSLSIHTSCSQVLNVGDVFGGVTLIQYTSTEGGTVGQGVPSDVCEAKSDDEVKFIYTITNKGDKLTGVTAFDNPHAPLPGGIPGVPSEMDPGYSDTFTLMVDIIEYVTNIFTVSGKLANGKDCEVTAEATVTEPPQVCEKDSDGDVQAMKLSYLGGSITAGDDEMIVVEIKAEQFKSDKVYYKLDPGVPLNNGDVLAKAGENGQTIDADAHGKDTLGKKTEIKIYKTTLTGKKIKGTEIKGKIITDCKCPFVSENPAPGDKCKPSDWQVENFVMS